MQKTTVSISQKNNFHTINSLPVSLESNDLMDKDIKTNYI